MFPPWPPHCSLLAKLCFFFLPLGTGGASDAAGKEHRRQGFYGPRSFGIRELVGGGGSGSVALSSGGSKNSLVGNEPFIFIPAHGESGVNKLGYMSEGKAAPLEVTCHLYPRPYHCGVLRRGPPFCHPHFRNSYHPFPSTQYFCSTLWLSEFYNNCA